MPDLNRKKEQFNLQDLSISRTTLPSNYCFFYHKCKVVAELTHKNSEDSYLVWQIAKLNKKEEIPPLITFIKKSPLVAFKYEIELYDENTLITPSINRLRKISKELIVAKDIHAPNLVVKPYENDSSFMDKEFCESFIKGEYLATTRGNFAGHDYMQHLIGILSLPRAYSSFLIKAAEIALDNSLEVNTKEGFINTSAIADLIDRVTYKLTYFLVDPAPTKKKFSECFNFAKIAKLRDDEFEYLHKRVGFTEDLNPDTLYDDFIELWFK